MTAPHDLDRQLDAFLRDGPIELPNPSFDEVRDRMEVTHQRVVLGPWRVPDMNKLIPIGLGAVAVVVAVFVGARLLGPAPSGPGAAPSVAPSITAEPSEAAASVAPTSTPDDSLAEGPFLVSDPATQKAPFDQGLPVTVTIPAAGWRALPEFGSIVQGPLVDEGDGAGAGLLAGDSGLDGYYVYGDPCNWESTKPDTPATTVDEIVEAMAAQPSRGATAPMDVTVGGYTGKSITLYVPTTAPDFKDCDQGEFSTYGVEGLEGPSRWQQGAGQVDEYWILDVGGRIAILDATYGPATPADLVEEVRTIAESATFGAP